MCQKYSSKKMKFSSFFVWLFWVYCIIILNYFLNYKDMWDLGVLKHFANPNSLGEIHKKNQKKKG